MFRKTSCVFCVLVLGAVLAGLAGCGGRGYEGELPADSIPGAREIVYGSTDPAAVQKAVDFLMEKAPDTDSLMIMNGRLSREADPAIKDILQKAVDELGPKIQQQREEYERTRGVITD